MIVSKIQTLFLNVSIYSLNTFFTAPPNCNKNETYCPCGTACPETCLNKGGNCTCTEQCVEGCFCNKGLVRADDGSCVKPKDCRELLTLLFFFTVFPKEQKEYMKRYLCFELYEKGIKEKSVWDNANGKQWSKNNIG